MRTLLKRQLSFHPNREWKLQLQQSSLLHCGKILTLLRHAVRSSWTPAARSSKAVIDMTLGNTRVTQSKRKSIADMTHSHIKWAKKFRSAEPFACTCGKCAQGMPGQARAENVFPTVFGTTSKYTPTPDKTALQHELQAAFKTLGQAMADHGVVDLTTFQSAISQADLAPLVGTPTENAVVTKLDVIKIQKALSKWVVLPLDKDSGSTYLMCPALFWQRLNKLYSVDTPNYTAVSLNADRILSDITHGLNTHTLAERSCQLPRVSAVSHMATFNPRTRIWKIGTDQPCPISATRIKQNCESQDEL